MLEQENVGRLISAYGGDLVNLMVKGEERQEWIEKSSRLPVVQITPRSLCDLELLATGAFSPLTRFMGKADYQRVIHEMRLENGTLFPMPVTLPMDPKILEGGVEQVVLSDARNNRLAVMQIEEVYEWDAEEEAQSVLGTTDLRHPLVSEMKRWGKVYVSGEIKMLELPRYHDFTDLRRTPGRRPYQRGHPARAHCRSRRRSSRRPGWRRSRSTASSRGPRHPWSRTGARPRSPR